jgi:hypothetical protein
MQKDLELRSARKGKGFLPPNPKRWEHEHNGLDLRHKLSLSVDERLGHMDAFELLQDVHVLPHTHLKVSADHAQYLSGEGASRWSGMCVPAAEATLVIYNDTHDIRRVRATLMEEFFHLWLEHRPTRLRLMANGQGGRDYDGGKESEAYGSGAAALLPYKGLRAMLVAGKDRSQIAAHFEVSEPLVDFRIQVSRLNRISGKK